MKNQIRIGSLLAVVLALAALAIPYAFAQTANNALSMSGLAITPSPLIAGENATIVFQLYNSYSSPLNNVNLQVTASNPIINVSPSSTTLISSIGTGLYGGGSGYASFYYKVHIPAQTSAGEYTIDVVANYQTQLPGSPGTQEPAESTLPINLYIYGTPDIALNANLHNATVPGAYTSIPITVSNGGTDKVYNLTLQIQGSNSFMISGPEFFNLGSIAAGSSSVISPTFETGRYITNGTYNISAIENYTTAYGNTISKQVSVPITVQLNNPDIAVSITQATPSNLYPGTNQTIAISVQNVGLGTAKNVTLKFSPNSGINVGSVSSFFIGSLAAGASQTLSLFISANQSAYSSSYVVPASISYYNSNFASQTNVTKYIPISVQNLAIFNITGINESLTAGVTYKPLELMIKNIGNNNAQQVTLSLQSTYPITPANPNIYINSLAPGASANVIFYVDVDQNANPGIYPITVYEQWRQPNGAQGQEFSASQDYYSQVEASSGSGASGLVTPIIIVVVIIVAAIFIYRRMQAKKKTEASKPASKKS